MIGRKFQTASGKVFEVVKEKKRKVRKVTIYDYVLEDEKGERYEQSAGQLENTIRNSVIIR